MKAGLNVLVIVVILLHPLSLAELLAQDGLSLDTQFNRVRSEVGTAGTVDEGIAKLEHFAEKYPNHDLAAEAHLEIVYLLARKKKDVQGAIEKCKWLATHFPQARKRQYHTFGEISERMYREWREHTQEQPIFMGHYAWYELAKLHESAQQYERALAAYDRILSSLEPDRIPVTKNSAVIRTFRLHKTSLESKIELLHKTGRKEEARKTEVEYQKLYPAEDWKQLALEASRAAASGLYNDPTPESRQTSDRITLLRAKLNNKDPQLRKEAVLEFSQMKDDEALQLYLYVLTFEKDSDIRRVAASELTKFVEEKLKPKTIVVGKTDPELAAQIEHHIEVMRKTYEVERKRGAYDDAYMKLIEIGRSAVPSLVVLMKDKKEGVRIRASALQILGHMKYPIAIGPLMTMLREEDSEYIRLNASSALGNVLRPLIVTVKESS